MKNRLLVAVVAALVLLAAVGCAPGNARWQSPDNPAGFWAGLWHGFIIVVTFIVSLFNHSVGVYESNNAGWSYNLGFLLGCMASLGGGIRAGTRRKRRRTDWDRLGRHVANGVRDGVRGWLREAAGGEQPEPDWDELSRQIEERLREEFRRWGEEFHD